MAKLIQTQVETYNAASKMWTDALRARDNFAPFRPLFETLDHSNIVRAELGWV